jgi:hypothetical protein
MNWELYEVWAVDDSGHEELIETTKSRKEAFDVAKKTLDDGYIKTIVYAETEDGDLEKVQQFEQG